MNIPIVMAPYEDELLVSWVFRLMRANCFRRMEDFERAAAGKRIPGDGYFDASRLADALGIRGMSPGGMLVKHTPFPAHCARMPEAELKNILGVMTGAGERSFPAKCILYCPECVREVCDPLGSPVIFRFHQEARACPVHGVPLRKCSIRRDRRESWWTFSGHEMRYGEWRFSRGAFALDCMYAEFARDLMRLELPLSRERTEHTVTSYLKGNGVDCGDINDVQEYLLDTAGAEDWFCLQEAGDISGGLSALTGPKLLRAAFAVFGSAGELGKAFRTAFPAEADGSVQERLPGNVTSVTDCGCGVFEIHAADGSVRLTRRDDVRTPPCMNPGGDVPGEREDVNEQKHIG